MVCRGITPTTNKGRQHVRSCGTQRCMIVVEAAVLVVNRGLRFHRVPCLRLAAATKRADGRWNRRVENIH